MEEIKKLANKSLSYSLINEAYEATCEMVKEIPELEKRLDVSLGVQIFLTKLIDVFKES